MLIGRQTQGRRVRAERGASMVVALVATVAVLGFGAVVLQMVEADVRGVTARLEREEAVLHAEYALSEAVARVIDGQEATANGGGSWMERRTWVATTVTSRGPSSVVPVRISQSRR